MSKNLNTILAFYDTKAEQDRYREDVDRACSIACGVKNPLPFVVRRAHSSGTTANLTLGVYDSTTDTEVLDHTNAPVVPAVTYLSIVSGTTYDYIWYDGTTIAEQIPVGEFYFKLTDQYPTPDKVYYSEVFSVQASLTGYLKLWFQNTLQLSNIMAGMIQWVWVDNSLKAPEYVREEVGEKRDGVMVFEKQIQMKADILRFLTAPEYLVDALMLLDKMDIVRIYDGSDCYNWDEVQVKDPEWNADLKGARAKVEIRLLSDLVIKKLNFKEMGCNCNSSSSAIHTEYKTASITGGSTATITFDVPFNDTTYVYVYTALDALGNNVLCTVTNKTVNGMTWGAIDTCTLHLHVMGAL